ncbi:MAG: hypothetical protein OXE53_02970 [Deltaproteobacteria bacterium]|nr:hypothetical protein [Deltaproteobacteria bacterium]
MRTTRHRVDTAVVVLARLVGRRKVERLAKVRTIRRTAPRRRPP